MLMQVRDLSCFIFVLHLVVIIVAVLQMTEADQKMRQSRLEQSPRIRPTRPLFGRHSPRILVALEAALAADLSMALTFFWNLGRPC